MESVPLHTLVKVRPRQAKHPLVLRHRGVERGVEAGDLRYPRKKTRCVPDLGQIVRLVQGGKWGEGFQF